MKKKDTAPVEAKILKSIKAIQPIPKDDVFNIPSSPYDKMTGSFGTIQKTGEKITGIHWEGCRDRFQTASDPEAYMDFLFCHQPKAGDNVIDFIHTVEEIIKLKDEERLVFKKTNNPNIIYVKLSDWWKYRVRRSLLTALLRCGQEYVERNSDAFDKALFSQYYTFQTKPAVLEFLKGRTASKLKRRSGFSGWYQQFVNKKSDEARQVLCKLKPKPEVAPENLEVSEVELKQPIHVPELKEGTNENKG